MRVLIVRCGLALAPPPIGSRLGPDEYESADMGLTVGVSERLGQYVVLLPTTLCLSIPDECA